MNKSATIFSNLIFLLFFFFITLAASAQDISMRFSHLTLEDGLSQSTVNDILQDRKGFLWFATEDGLNRYNGYEFKVFKFQSGNSGSISNNSISDIIEDEKGNIWVGTKGGGLNKFDPITEKFTHFESRSDDPQSLSAPYVTALFEDQSGVILVGTRKGLNIYQPDTNTFLQYQPEEGNANSLKGEWITAIYEDSKGMIWIGTQDEGLSRLDRSKDKFTHFSNIAGDPNSLSDNWVVSIYEDKKNNLWIGTQAGGMNKFRRENQNFQRYQNNPDQRYSLSHNWVYTMFEDRFGEFWVGTLNGLNRFDRENDQFISITALKGAPNLNNKSITALFEDRSGVFWVGTKDDALYKFVRSTQNFMVYDQNAESEISLSNNNIWAVKEIDNGDIWVGTYGGGINIIDKQTKQVSYLKYDPEDPASLSDNFVNTIFQDNEGTIWVGTINGLCRYDASAHSFTRFFHQPDKDSSLAGNIVMTLSQDDAGNIWVGTLNNGFSKFNKQTQKFTNYKSESTAKEGLAQNKIWSIYKDDEGVFWVGTHGFGLAIYALNEGEYRRYVHNPADSTSISNDFINVTYKDSQGRYWVGTLNGLNRFYPTTQTFDHFTTADGLPNNVIYGIVEDNRGHLWLSTNKGLCDFDPETGEVRNYDAGDGLPSEEFRFGSYNKGKDGTIYFGSINGLVSFEADNMVSNQSIPPVVFTNFEISNNPVAIGPESVLKKSISATEELSLSYKDQVFSFQFAGLHYAAPEQNKYAYKMEGFDKGWQNIGNRRFISFTTLPAGTYNLQIRAANKDGLWNNKGASIKLTIEPAPWFSWWAYTIYATFALAMVGWVVSYRVAKERKEKEKVKQQREQLERMIDERTKELQNEKEKSDRLLYNILPKEVANELKESGKTTPKRFEEATILFTDFKGFTSTASNMSADRLVSEVNEIFKEFDNIIEEFGLEKIKTIGDAYMAAGGIPAENETHALRCVGAACQMLNFVEYHNKASSFKWEMRVGLHSGSVVAGVVGQKKFTYDLWGDTVNLASRMETIGEIGKVNISAHTHELVKEYFECEYRGKLDVSGRGKMDMYFVKKQIEGKTIFELPTEVVDE